MNIESLIYQGLQEQSAAGREVYLEDILRTRCLTRHAFRAHGEPAQERGPDILIREVTMRTRRMVVNYLKGCFPETFQPGGFRSHGCVTLLQDGVLREPNLEPALVEIAVVSTSEYNASHPPRVAVLSAAVKAHLLGYHDAVLVQMDRNTQEWSVWRLGGDFALPAGPVVQDLDYITGILHDEEAPTAQVAPAACTRCPYKQICSLSPSGPEENYLLRGVRAVPDPSLLTQLDAHLFRKNIEETGRRTHVFHPSSFSYETCDREQAYDLLGTEEEHRVDPKLRRIFDTGHCFHDLVQEQLSVMVPDFVAETSVEDAELRIAGHCDGEVGEDGFEIKSINDSGWKSAKSPKAEHKRQATIYAAIRKLKRVHYIYVNKETGELKVLTQKLNRSLWHKQAARATNIIKTVEAGKLPPPIDSNYTCGKCKYAWLCKPQRRTKPKRTFR